MLLSFVLGSIYLSCLGHMLTIYGWGGGEYVEFGAGGINFHPKHLGGHQNSIGNLYGGGGT